ncbi:MAG: DUF488 domain-containing protein [Anaerolineae bacterium]
MPPETNAPDALVIYTIGHSNVPVSELVRLLEMYSIRQVADVRSIPYSRHNPQYNRELLAGTLLASGIAYRWMGDTLGGRPRDPALYTDQCPPDAPAACLRSLDYPRVWQLESFRRGIAELLELARRAPTALLCAENDPRKCHRHHLIGVYLSYKGVVVWHIRGDGSLLADASITDQAG